MNPDVFFTPNAIAEKSIRNHVVVVIDVLRASSTIATALHNGAKDLIPVPDMATASRIASNMDPDRFRLGGEQEGKKIEGYHLGNSPLEYTEAQVSGRTVVYKTTNGTDTILHAQTATHVVVGSFLNAQAVVDFIQQTDMQTTLICAGWHKRAAFEDILCAGLILSRLWDGRAPRDATDTAHVAYVLYKHDRQRLQEALMQADHAVRLKALGYEADVAYCAQLDLLDVLPRFKDNRLVAR